MTLYGGMDMINWLNVWLQDENTKLLYILSLILVANLLDFLFGVINAKFNENVSFSSKKAKNGLFVKIGFFILLVYVIPIALLLPDGIGISALYVLYVSYLVIEINSLLAHFRLTEDDKRTELFIDFINRIFAKGGNKK